ncbi:MAG: Multiple sugar transport system permease protein [Propionibacteriaceae bacterium]|jgi:multiple sugar transport system permease protein|nr:Multiple sugar transport system permease protein [Propionibacteriaceae bacterium]
MTRYMKDVRSSMPHIAWWVVCVCLALVFLYPIYVMLGMALKGPAEQGLIPPTLFPNAPTLENFSRLASVQGLNVFGNVANSVVVTLAATVGTVLVATLAGYALARAKFPGSGILFFLILATFMIPFQAIITPLFMVLKTLGLNNSLLGLVIVYVTFNLPFGLFIMRNSFAAVPHTLEEAGQVDGCGIFGGLRHILLPIVLPGVITTALLTFFASWNEFFAALILITDQDKFTLPVTLTLVSSGQFGTVNWGSLQAGVALTIIPCIVIYVLLQRYYVSGMLSGALK